MKKAALFSVLLTACAQRGSTTEASQWSKASQQDKEAATQKISEGDAAFDGRLDRKQLEAAIAAYEEAVKLNPHSFRTRARLARSYYLLADGFVSFENDVPALLAAYEKGIKEGERAIRAYSAEVDKKLDLGAELEEAAELIDRDGVPAMYWYASSLGKWAKKQGIQKAVLYKDRIRKIMERCKALDEDYYFGGPNRYFGAYYSFAPPFAGGDLEKGKEHFEAAISRFPGNLATRVLYAEIYATKIQDEDLFRKQLETVLAADPAAIPDIQPENTIEQKKAKSLLDQIDEYF